MQSNNKNINQQITLFGNSFEIELPPQHLEGFNDLFAKLLQAIEKDNLGEFRNLLSQSIKVDSLEVPLENLLFQPEFNLVSFENINGSRIEISVSSKMKQLLSCVLNYHAAKIADYLFSNAANQNDASKFKFATSIVIPLEVIEEYLKVSNEYVMSMLAGFNLLLTGDNSLLGRSRYMTDFIDPFLANRDPHSCALKFFKKYFHQLLEKTNATGQLSDLMLKVKYLRTEDQYLFVNYCHDVLTKNILNTQQQIEDSSSKILKTSSINCYYWYTKYLSVLHNENYIDSNNKNNILNLIQNFKPTLENAIIDEVKILNDSLERTINAIKELRDKSPDSSEQKFIYSNVIAGIEYALKNYNEDTLSDIFAKMKIVVNEIVQTFNSLINNHAQAGVAQTLVGALLANTNNWVRWVTFDSVPHSKNIKAVYHQSILDLKELTEDQLANVNINTKIESGKQPKA